MNKRIKILSFLAIIFLVISCENNKKNEPATIYGLNYSALVDKPASSPIQLDSLYADMLNTKNIDTEIESLFFNHGRASGLLPKGVKVSTEDPGFLIISESQNNNLKELNSRSFPNGTRVVTVAALDLFLDENHRLIKTYNNQADIETMIIIADRVKLSTTFKLPATNLIIKAREIILEDQGVIDLTPLSLLEKPNQLENGKNGASSGNLNLFSDKFSVLGELNNRIILDGGRGQNAGLGKKGLPGTSMAPAILRATPSTDPRYPNAVYVDVIIARAGSKQWPGDGGDATPGGLPGSGGNAGSFYHGFTEESLLKKITSLKSGLPGNHAPSIEGGDPGQPSPAVWKEVVAIDPFHHKEVITTHTSVSGKSAVRLNTIPSGSVGTINFSQNKINELAIDESFQKAAIAQLGVKLRYARSLYMNFFIDEAYLNFKEVINNFPEPANIINQEIKNASLVEITKIESHLDYFGNEVTWFPELSFEINKAFNEKEIETSFANLYYVYALKNSQNTVENKIKAIEALQKNIYQNTTNQQISINDSLDKIPDIQNLVELISSKEKLVQEELITIENEIHSQAVLNLTPDKHKKTLKIIAAICTVFPAGQPALGIVANSLLKISEMRDNDKDWIAVIKDGVGIYNDIKNADWEASRTNWNENYGKLINESWKGMTSDQIQARLKKIYEAGKPLIDIIIAQKKSINQNEAPRSEIEQQIVNIKNTHPRYNKVVKLLAELVEEKQLFVRSLNDISNKIVTSRETIVGNFIQTSELSSEYLTASGNYNPQFNQSLSGLEERAKSNLLKYRYYFLKSYGYRFLKSPQMDYNPVDIFNKIVEMINYNKGGDLSREQYTLLKQVFIQDLQPLMTDVLSNIQMGEKAYSASTTLYFTKEEIDKLSNGETLLVNLKMRDIFSESEEDIRISNMTVSKFHLDNVVSVTNPNIDLELIHTGRFDLTKNGKTFAFEMSNPSKWVYRYNMIEAHGEMMAIAKSFKALITSLLATFDRPIVENNSLEFFSLLGGNGELKVKFRDDSIKRLKGATLTDLSIRIDYVYSPSI